MTSDLIAVERQYEGERCGPFCRELEERFYVCLCHAFNTALDKRKDGRAKRCSRCLATPSVRVLTPEMQAAVVNLYLTMREHLDSNYGCSGAYSVRGEAMHQAKEAFPELLGDFT